MSATRDECERRDRKHLYADVAAGAARGLPGVDLVFEAPAHPEVIAVGGYDDDAVDCVLDLIDDRGSYRSGVLRAATSP